MSTEMTDAEKAIERQSVEAVFRLGGGELNGAPFAPGLRYWYDDLPSYAGEDFGKARHDSGRFVTVCWAPGFILSPPAFIERNGVVWLQRRYYPSSGEVECDGANEDVNLVTERHTGTGGGNICVLCGETLGKPHGHIYLGEPCGEVVYESTREILVTMCNDSDHAVARHADDVRELGYGAVNAVREAVEQGDAPGLLADQIDVAISALQAMRAIVGAVAASIIEAKEK